MDGHKTKSHFDQTRIEEAAVVAVSVTPNDIAGISAANNNCNCLLLSVTIFSYYCWFFCLFCKLKTEFYHHLRELFAAKMNVGALVLRS